MGVSRIVDRDDLVAVRDWLNLHHNEGGQLDRDLLETRCRAICKVEARVQGVTHPSTGILVTPTRVLTTNHSFTGTTRRRVNPGNLKEAKVVFDFGPLVTECVTVSVDPGGPVISRSGLDFALVTLAESIETIAPIPLLRWANVKEGDHIYVVGHPDSGPLSFAPVDNTVTWVEFPLVRYRSDTRGGSSGSPVFDANLSLVAIHHRGDPRIAPAEYNEGTLVDAIFPVVHNSLRL